ncbi:MULTISPECIES: tryptophan 2,3-dioxygenase family protein [Pseudidiomarina]|uniref:Tryptophan 2,3-dioxygenase n=3 Tax=Pseudidiomarina TaxID=2800384 RepID=A0A368VAG4_9GAMM|nr:MULTISPECIES: tryptophan 2,3-dioxygenase family protein [Pseudidiomarina]PWW15979.1 tryptophan 2,3-dioxygenase [Pseudidiomarina maritima]RBP93511.1 tryptophan 2,3-dioxygenase [Pseudidiomarina tainanensis]RCW35971.1 tryptophan 2,3-dioxygenase [Pseudidiomarina tainanensis]
MPKNIEPVYYGEYLQLDKLLDAQAPHSRKYGAEAHDETLFIIVHQVYELWFKQVLHELRSIHQALQADQLDDRTLYTLAHRLRRVLAIQDLMNDQVGIIETMTPQEFLAFRDYLVPASGFQSIQFKELEILLGLTRGHRIAFDQQSFYNRLNDTDRAYLEALEQQPSLFDRVDAWLARMPFLEFNDFSFWQTYQQAVTAALDHDEKIIRETAATPEQLATELASLQSNRDNFAALFDNNRYIELQKNGQVRLSQQAMLSALFITQYREEPAFHLAHQVITGLAEMDEKLTIWRYKHAMMVQRMLGTKIGTGGSSGHDYLRRTTEQNRVFKDFFAMATYLLPKAALPELPAHVQQALGFYFRSNHATA